MPLCSSVLRSKQRSFRIDSKVHPKIKVSPTLSMELQHENFLFNRLNNRGW